MHSKTKTNIEINHIIICVSHLFLSEKECFVVLLNGNQIKIKRTNTRRQTFWILYMRIEYRNTDMQAD